MRDQRERLTKHAGRVAAVHWQRLLHRIRAGEPVAAECEGRFLATDEMVRLELAEQFYGEAHVALLAALGEPGLPLLMTPWLSDAIDHVLADYEPGEGPDSGDRNPERMFIERLVTSQYVIVIEDRERRGSNGRLVRGFPGDGALYSTFGDLCAAGASGACTVRLHKATGEPFTEAEMEVTFVAMQDSFYAHAVDDADEDSWQFEWVNEGDDDRAIVVEIEELFPEEEDEEEDEDELVLADDQEDEERKDRG
jgi:hypothetical protein